MKIIDIRLILTPSKIAALTDAHVNELPYLAFDCKTRYGSNGRPALQVSVGMHLLSAAELSTELIDHAERETSGIVVVDAAAGARVDDDV